LLRDIASTTTNAAGTNFLLPTHHLHRNYCTLVTVFFMRSEQTTCGSVLTAGNYTLTQTENVAVGPSAPLNAITSGSGNTALGSAAGQILTSEQPIYALGSKRA
jgi:hypothetical protein